MALLTTSTRPSARRPMPGRRRTRWRAALALMFLAGRLAAAVLAPAPEYQVKAVFLFNFAQFVDWPAAAFADAQAPLVIGVLGDDPFGPFLDDTVRGEKVNGRALVVRRYQRADEIKDCHILFVSKSEAARLEQILSSLKGRPILTVGDTEGYTLRGVLVRFTTVEGKIHLRINADAAKADGLTISSKLLRLAELAAPGKD